MKIWKILERLATVPFFAISAFVLSCAWSAYFYPVNTLHGPADPNDPNLRINHGVGLFFLFYGLAIAVPTAMWLRRTWK